MENTNKHNEIDLIDLLKKIWTERKKIIKLGLVGLVAGIIVAFSIPKEYTSKAKVAPEGQQNIGVSGSMQALTGMIGIGSMSSLNNGLTEVMYPEIIKSTPFLLEFTDIKVDYKNEKISFSEFLLNKRKQAWWKTIIGIPFSVIGWIVSIADDKIETLTIKNSPTIQQSFCKLMNKAIKLESDKKSGVITVTSTFQDSKIAKLISDSVLSKLNRYVINYRTAKTRQTLEANLKMLEQAKERYYIADEEYAVAQDRNLNLTTKSAGVKLERLGNVRDLAYQIYQQLAMQVEADKIKLQEEQIIVTIIEPSITPTQPSAPNKIMIILTMGLLSCAISAVVIAIKKVYLHNN